MGRMEMNRIRVEAMQFRECDDGEGAEGNCYRRLQWPERFDLIHVAMLLFPEFMRLAFCLKDSSRLAAPLWRGECEDL